MNTINMLFLDDLTRIKVKDAEGELVLQCTVLSDALINLVQAANFSEIDGTLPALPTELKVQATKDVVIFYFEPEKPVSIGRAELLPALIKGRADAKAQQILERPITQPRTAEERDPASCSGVRPEGLTGPVEGTERHS